MRDPRAWRRVGLGAEDDGDVHHVVGKPAELEEGAETGVGLDAEHQDGEGVEVHGGLQAGRVGSSAVQTLNGLRFLTSYYSRKKTFCQGDKYVIGANISRKEVEGVRW